jgi:ABC transporter substrate binding protein (PQQ-dependent alcohol dehydrogenase system)
MRRAARGAAAAAGDSAAAELALWHESLTMYGAAQLNDRFRARFGRGMDGDAWAAWMAVKVATEAALRVRDVTPDTLAAYLARPNVRFDGHKGRPLSFGASDHQLRQPLYAIRPAPEGGARAVEVPMVAGGASAGGKCGGR